MKVVMVLTKETLDEILEYLDKITDNLAKDAFENLEIEGGFAGIESFLQNQFDIRLENLLVAKKSSIHHLESGMKNIVIQRKQIIFERISKQHKN
jgi:predicted transcriptional regulator